MSSAITPERIAQIINESPLSSKLVMPGEDEQVRFDAVSKLGEHVYHSLFRTIDVDRDQLPLPL